MEQSMLVRVQGKRIVRARPEQFEEKTRTVRREEEKYMRRMGYLAAAATGVLAPLALALPASAAPATTVTPASHSFLGGLLGDGDSRDDDSRYSGSVDAYASKADRDGDVSIIVWGEDFPPHMDLRLTSAGLDAACRDGNSIDGAHAETDLDGDFNLVGTGETCIDGTYRIDVTEQSTPYQTFSAYVTIRN
jgi:hypothetical protein